VEVHNAVVHQLIKEADQKNTADKLLRDEVFDKDSNVLISFLKSIQTAYSKRAKATGQFDTDIDEYPFQRYLDDYISGGELTSQSFLTFTERSMTRLVNQAKSQVKATGGFVLFLHYKVNGNSYLMVLILSQKHVFNIDDLDLKALEAVDPDTLRYAVRIDINKWKQEQDSQDDRPYLNFLRGKSAQVADYFQSFIGCTDFSPAKQSTDGMIEACHKYLTEIKNLDTEQRRQADKEILQYCTERRNVGEMVSLNTIAAMMNPEDPNEFIDYVDKNELFFPEFFEAHPTSLRKLKRYKYKTKKWDLAFDHDVFGEKVIYDKNTNTILIRDVPDDFVSQTDIDNE
jgi:nucleoid-associated protein